MTKESDLRPGDIFVTATYGSGFDRFVGSSIRYLTATQDQYGKWQNAKVNHTGMYVGDGKLVEAQPGGARLANWNTHGDNATWSVGGLRDVHLDDAARTRVADAAIQLVGTPYGFLDIVAIAFAQQRMRHLVDPSKPLRDQPWWVRRIEDQHTLICSQLVDTAYELAGVHLFQDSRIPGLVSPNDIDGLFL